MKLFARRRAQRFAELIEEPANPSPVGRHHHTRTGQHGRDADDRLAPLVSLGHAVAHRADSLGRGAAIDPDFRANLRQRLMADANLHGVGVTRVDDDPDGEPAEDATARRRRRLRAPAVWTARPRRTRLAIAGGVTAALLGVAGVAGASTVANPGDPLYHVKRSTERAQLALAGSDVNSGELYLRFARTRAGEAASVRDRPDELRRTLDEMDRQTRRGVALLDGTAVRRKDPASLTKVATFAANQRPDLVRLLSGLDGRSRTRALKSLALVDEADHRAGDLHKLLLCTAGQQIRRDRLGPVPRHCSTVSGGGAPGTAPSSPAAGPSDTDRPDENANTPSHRPDADRSPTAGAPSGTPAGQQTPSDTPGSGTPSASPSGDDDGGLLGTIGKILGGLL